MKTKQELFQEVSNLKLRLEKAVFFEITENTSIGISESDGLFRIRRMEPDGAVYFLNKNYQWEEQLRHVDLAYTQRTGYNTAIEAFDILEATQNLDNHFFVPPNMLKNN